MPEFRYIARDLSGREFSDLLTANSELDVVSQLSAKQLFPLKIQATESSKSPALAWARPIM